QNLQLGQLRNRIVAVLNLFEQVAEVIEEAWDALERQFLDDRGRQVRLADPTRAEEQQTDINRRELIYDIFRIVERPSLRYAGFIGGQYRLVTLERAVLVPPRDVGCGQQLSSTVLGATPAEANTFLIHRFPSRATAEFTDSQLKLSQVLSHSLIG